MPDRAADGVRRAQVGAAAGPDLPDRRTYAKVRMYVRSHHMSKTLTATEFRANLYRIIDQVLNTGRPCRVTRGKRAVLVRPDTVKRRRLDLSKLKRRDDVLNCTFDELVATTFPYRADPNI